MFGRRVEPIGVYSVESVLEGLKVSLLNNILWPDFTEIPDTHTPTLDFRSLPEGKATRLGPWRVTPVRLSHTVVSVGYLIEEESGAILHLGDTGPSEEIWSFAKKVQNLKAVMIETSFPNRLQDLANISGHLTPRTLKTELAKTELRAQVYVHHLKPQYEQEVIRELKELVPECQLLEQGREYRF
jgi:cAMP phosphodiesterase